MVVRCRPRAPRCEALPGVGRKTANVVLNMWWGHPAQAVDTHIFRVGNRSWDRARARTVVAVERAIEDNVPADLSTPCPSLADLAWPLYLQVARKPKCGACPIS